MRGEVLTLRERDFVRLAEVNGVSTFDIIRRHLLPNVMNTVMVFFTLIVGVAIIIEANLSFLGVGVPPPEPAWGLMISQERDALMEGKWWLAVWPGLCIMLLVLSPTWRATGCGCVSTRSCVTASTAYRNCRASLTRENPLF